ncbi:C4-dicarboxylate ABC transporter [Microvirga sp. KLBC 81]|uniref:TRAP transporter small permease n=1 Tax=Microvirga sp. KLBC 81 TaxID=1862707 RepID=UPI000D5136B2|nr:TRAP transporter small permease subunit [Microvirga sp. KLBC 81]PVE21272.1 C4-dicarboxylate ABC transporter [Microvirga sp. KLBC 81]
MRNVIAAILAAALAICRYGTIAAFSVLIGVVTIQVLGRVPGFPSPSWTEEVARFALVYLVAFSCGVAVLRGELVNVDLFVGPLPESVRRVIDRIVDLIIFGFAIAIIPGAYDYVAGSIGERARSIDIPMVVIYVVTLIIPISLAFFSLARLFGFGQSAPASHGELL